MVMASNVKRWGLILLVLVGIGSGGYFYKKERVRAATVASLCEAELHRRLPKAQSFSVSPNRHTSKGAVNLFQATVVSTLASGETEQDDMLCIVHGSQSALGLDQQSGTYTIYKLVLGPR